jgi:hypothetical protein
MTRPVWENCTNEKTCLLRRGDGSHPRTDSEETLNTRIRELERDTSQLQSLVTELRMHLTNELENGLHEAAHFSRLITTVQDHHQIEDRLSAVGVAWHIRKAAVLDRFTWHGRELEAITRYG